MPESRTSIPALTAFDSWPTLAVPPALERAARWLADTPLPASLFVAGATTTGLCLIRASVSASVNGGNLTGWGCQLLLSAGSIYMLLGRNHPKGQSMYIGLFRMFGTLCLIYAQESYERPFTFLRFVYVAGPILDIAYLWLLHRTCRAHGISPWRRI
jgi:hypothetical protein